jgi:hypothetical protein
MQYKTVQFYPVTSSKSDAMAVFLYNVIQTAANDGWLYLRTECFQQAVPNSCCFIPLGTSTIVNTYVAVFYKR